MRVRKGRIQLRASLRKRLCSVSKHSLSHHCRTFFEKLQDDTEIVRLLVKVYFTSNFINHWWCNVRAAILQFLLLAKQLAKSLSTGGGRPEMRQARVLAQGQTAKIIQTWRWLSGSQANTSNDTKWTTLAKCHRCLLNKKNETWMTRTNLISIWIVQAMYRP